MVAVKMLKESASQKEKDDLLAELKLMKMLLTESHPNVVRLLGACTGNTDKEPTYVIMEYVSKGKLQEFLRKSRAEHYYGNLHGSSQKLTSRDLTSFCYQVCRVASLVGLNIWCSRLPREWSFCPHARSSTETWLQETSLCLTQMFARWLTLASPETSWPTIFMRGNLKEGCPSGGWLLRHCMTMSTQRKLHTHYTP